MCNYAPPGEPQIEIRLLLNELAYWGLSPVEVMNTVHAGFEGTVVGQVNEDNRVFDVVVILPKSQRQQPEDVLMLPIKTPLGVMLRLKDVADIQQVSSRHMILHAGAQRLQTVTSNVTGRDLASFFAELKQRVHDEVEFSADIYPEFTGAAVAQAQSREDLIVHSSWLCHR